MFGCISLSFQDLFSVCGEIILEIVHRSIQKFEKGVELLRYKNHNCYVINVTSLFKAFPCSTIHAVFPKLVTWKNGYSTWKICTTRRMFTSLRFFFHKLDEPSICYKKEQEALDELAVSVFESTRVGEQTYKEAETTKRTENMCQLILAHVFSPFCSLCLLVRFLSDAFWFENRNRQLFKRLLFFLVANPGFI